MKSSPWTEPRIVEWSHRLLESYHYWIRQDLIDRAGDRKAQTLRLFEASVVVVSHGVEPDPILNYGNQAALDLWELSWEQFIQTPSRLTAEADDRTERRRMLEQAKLTGYFDGYRGVRISSTGKRFLVEQAVIWNVIDPAGHRIGQAAMFSQWSYLG
ncbi:MAG: MEKHLA domain-containing protein [Nitrospira sp.]|jgi:MEKHLA domain